MAKVPEEIKPGPTQGQKRNFVAPNNGSLGGRPQTQPSMTASPMETLSGSLPAIVPPPQPVPTPTPAPAPAPAPQPGFGPIQQQPTAVSPVAPIVQPQPPPVVAAPQPAVPPVVPQPTAAPTGQIPQVIAPPQPANVQLPRAPQDIVPAPDGSKVTTPLGTATVSGGVPGNYDLSPQGREAYGRAKMARVQKFGRHPWVNDPKAPQPPVEPGAPSFNPFEGTWSED